MLVTAGFAAFALIGLAAVVAREMWRAPEGYQDAEGFHFAPEKAQRTNIPAAGVSKSAKSRESGRIGRRVPGHA